MRILVVTNMYPSAEHPAAGTFVQQQVKGLTDSGLDVTVMLVERLRKGPLAYLGLRRRLTLQLQQSSFALIHVMYGGVMAKTVVQAASKLPVVVSLCGSDLLGENLPGWFRRAAVRYGVWCSLVAARRAAGVIVKSRNLWEALPADVARNKVCILPNGVDLQRFQPLNTETCRRRLNWEPDKFHVLFPANSGSPLKRFWLAKAAAEVARQEQLPVTLHRLEGVKHQDVPLWLNASDCLLLTSEHEGSPNIVKEALACNVPVVSVDVGDVAERINEIGGCYICCSEPRDLAAGLRAVARGPRRTQSRTRMNGLSLEQVAQRLVRFYHEVLNRARRLQPGEPQWNS